MKFFLFTKKCKLFLLNIIIHISLCMCVFNIHSLFSSSDSWSSMLMMSCFSFFFIFHSFMSLRANTNIKKESMKRHSRDSRQTLFLWIPFYLFHIFLLLFRLFYLLLLLMVSEDFSILCLVYSIKDVNATDAFTTFFGRENFHLSIDLHT